MASVVPFHRPYITGRELEYVARAIATGDLGERGEFDRRCSELIETWCGARKVYLTPSCTAALEMAAVLCGVGPGDEVLLPSFTFPSTANAFVKLGARPVFVDVRPDTLNLDESRVEAALTPRTRAILPVHYAGVACDMDAILGVARKHGVRVVEDAAQGFGAFYRGRHLGTLGDLGTFSFHASKNCTCGEGGAICLNAPDLLARADVVRNKGTNRSQFLLGKVDKYTWVDVGSSFVASELVCAFLYGQLREAEAITRRRCAVYGAYLQELRPLEEEGLLRLPGMPPGCQSNYHLFHLLLPDQVSRDGLMRYLHRSGIQAVFHYVPLHSSPMGQRFGYRAGDLPVTDDLSTRLLRLPCYPGLTADEQAHVVRHVKRFFGRGQDRPACGAGKGMRRRLSREG
jgi:dTDP-4-amino-4,6-dideoxygalactose transaminase